MSLPNSSGSHWRFTIQFLQSSPLNEKIQQGMATKFLAGIAEMQIIRIQALHRLNSSALTASCSICLADARRAGVPHLDCSVRRWRVRSVSGGYADLAETPQRMQSRLAQKQKLLDAAPHYPDDADAPIPKVAIVNTKVDMRFNVMSANWLPERVRLKLLQMEKNRINGDGDLVISSTRTRTQKGNIGDALEKIQEMISAAAYVPPPPSEETKKKIQKLARIENERRLQDKKTSSSKKADRRNKGSWD